MLLPDRLPGLVLLVGFWVPPPGRLGRGRVRSSTRHSFPPRAHVHCADNPGPGMV